MSNETSSALSVRIVGIETSSYCNRHCQLCPREELPDTRFENGNRKEPIKAFLEDTYVYSLFDQLAEFKFTGRVQMFSLNEPLLDERMPDFLKYAHGLGLKPRITTNGDPIRRDPTLLDRVAPYCDELSIGIYDYDMRKPDWETERNEMVEEWAAQVKPYEDNGLRVRYSLKEKFGRIPRDRDCGLAINASCDRVHEGIYVLYNGEVTHCCKDNQEGTIFGSIKEHSLLELLNSDARRFLHDALARGERWRFATCRDCLSSIPEEVLTEDPTIDRDGQILRLGMKYGLSRFPQPNTELSWKPQDHFNAGGPAATEVIAPLGVPVDLPEENYINLTISAGRQAAAAGPIDYESGPPARLLVPAAFTRQNRQDARHDDLMEVAEQRHAPDMPRLILIGESRMLRGTKAVPNLMERVYTGAAGQYNCQHYPATLGTIVSARKHCHVWQHARPKVFIYCMGLRDARQDLESDSSKVDMETFRAHVEVLLKKMANVPGTRAILVTPMPALATTDAGKNCSIDNDRLAEYVDAARTIAERCRVNCVDVFSAARALPTTDVAGNEYFLLSGLFEKLKLPAPAPLAGAQLSRS